MIKRVAVISINVILWVLSTYAIVQIFSFEGEDVNIKNGVEIITKTYNNDLLYNLLYTTIFKVAFFYFSVFFLAKFLFAKKHFKYWLLFFGSIIILLLFEKLTISSISSSNTIFYRYAPLGIGLYFFYGVISLIYSFLIQWWKDKKVKSDLIQQKATAELKLLRSQINPHFLFNALNNLLSIAEREKQKDVSNGIAQLSELLRYMLYDNSAEKVTINKEIEFIENYINLNKLRFDTKDLIDISFEVEGDTDTILIAPAILICFVENAFKHGIDIYEKSYINIKLEIIENKLLFKILNSIHLTKENNEFHPKSGGIGLENVKKRLDILYINKYVLDISNNKNEFSVNLELKL